MDGYAVRVADVASATALRVVDTLAAGAARAVPLGPGEAVRIMTGGVIPPGADAVVAREETRTEGEQVWIETRPAPGQHIRLAGADLRAGAVALEQGTRLKPAHVGILATLGVSTVPVWRKPHVGILATGSEIVSAASATQPGQQRDANGPALCALVQEAGAVAHHLGIVADFPPALRRTLSAALERCDMVLSCGGVSMGEYDYVKQVVADCGLQIQFHGVWMRPGRPLLFATHNSQLFFGLPGNPVSTQIGFAQFVRPALMHWFHALRPVPERFRAVLDEAVHKTDDKRHFLRSVVHCAADGRLHARLSGAQGSNLQHSLARANALLVFGEEQRTLEAGAEIEAEWLSPFAMDS